MTQLSKFYDSGRTIAVKLKHLCEKILDRLKRALNEKKLTTAARLLPLLLELENLGSTMDKKAKKARFTDKKPTPTSHKKIVLLSIQTFLTIADLTDAEIGLFLGEAMNVVLDWMHVNIANLVAPLVFSSGPSTEAQGPRLPDEVETPPSEGPEWTVLTNIFFSFMAVLGFFFDPVNTWWANKSKNVEVLAKNTRSLETIKSHILTLFGAGDEEEKAAYENLVVIEDFLKEYSLVPTLDKYDEIEETETDLNECRTRLDRWSKHKSKKIAAAHQRVSRLFDKAWESHISNKRTLAEVSDVRPLPVARHFWGPAGDGKTWGVNRVLIPKLIERLDLDVSRSGTIWKPPVGSSYSEKYTGQPFAVIDEFLAKNMEDPLIKDTSFNMMSTTSPTRVHGAAVDEKNMAFKPRFLFTLANQEKLIKPQNEGTVSYVEAVNSRINPIYWHQPYKNSKRNCPPMDKEGNEQPRHACLHLKETKCDFFSPCSDPESAIDMDDLVEQLATEYFANDRLYQDDIKRKRAELTRKVQRQGQTEPVCVVFYGPPGTGKTRLINAAATYLTDKGKTVSIMDDVLPERERDFCQAWDEAEQANLGTVFLIGANLRIETRRSCFVARKHFPELHSRTLRRLKVPWKASGSDGTTISPPLGNSFWFEKPSQSELFYGGKAVSFSRAMMDVAQAAVTNNRGVRIHFSEPAMIVPEQDRLLVRADGENLIFEDVQGLSTWERFGVRAAIGQYNASLITAAPELLIHDVETKLSNAGFDASFTLCVTGIKEHPLVIKRLSPGVYEVHGMAQPATPSGIDNTRSLNEIFRPVPTRFIKKSLEMAATLLCMAAAVTTIWKAFKSPKDPAIEDKRHVSLSDATIMDLTESLNKAAGIYYTVEPDEGGSHFDPTSESSDVLRSVTPRHVRAAQESRDDMRPVQRRDVRLAGESSDFFHKAPQPVRRQGEVISPAPVKYTCTPQNLAVDSVVQYLKREREMDPGVDAALKQHLLDFKCSQNAGQFTDVSLKAVANQVALRGPNGIMYGLMMQGRRGVCPAHVANKLGDSLVVYTQTDDITYDAKIFHYSAINDMACFMIESKTCPEYKDITRFLADEYFLSTRSYATVMRRRGDTFFFQFGSLTFYLGETAPFVCGNFSRDIGLINTPATDTFTRPGDCGSPVLLADKAAGHQLLVGMHAFVVNATGQMGFSLLTKQWWDSLVTAQVLPEINIKHIQGKNMKYPVTEEVYDLLSNVEPVQAKECLKNTDRINVLGIQPKPFVGNPNRTKFKGILCPLNEESPNHPSLVRKGFFDEDVIATWGKDLDGEPSRVWNQIRKCDVPDVAWDPSTRKSFVGQYASYLLQTAEDGELRVFNNFETNNKPMRGPLSSMTSSPKSTAAGFTLKKLYNVDKKAQLYEVDRHGQYTFKASPAADYLLACLRTMERTQTALYFPSIATEKDELLPTEKLRKGKVRLFSNVDAIQMFMSRKLLGCFIGFAKNHLHEIHHTVGMDPLTDFDAMEARLNVHPNVFTWDYSGWDKVMPRDLQQDAIDALKLVISSEYKEHAKLAQSQLDLMMHRLEVYRGTLFEYRATLASGIQLTNFLNSTVNDFVILHVIAGLTGETNMHRIHERCWWVTHGDDVKMSVSDEWADKINYFTVRDFLRDKHMTITPGEKSDEERAFESAFESSFISRYPHRFMGRVVGRLKKASIEKTMDWTKCDSTDHYMDLAETALEESCLWEESYFEKIRQKLNERLSRKLSRKYIFPDYEAYRSRLAHRMGAVYMPGLSVSRPDEVGQIELTEHLETAHPNPRTLNVEAQTCALRISASEKTETLRSMTNKVPMSLQEWDDLFDNHRDDTLLNPPAGLPYEKHTADFLKHADAVSKMGRRFFGTPFPNHDLSKMTNHEALGYTLQFFTDIKGTKFWKYALKHHYESNGHHPEHWTNPDKAEEEYSKEAFCDIIACMTGREISKWKGVERRNPYYNDIDGCLKHLLEEWQDPNEPNNKRFGNWIGRFIGYANVYLNKDNIDGLRTSWTCESCDVTMDSGSAYAKHMKNSHPGKPCAYCERVKHLPTCSTQLMYRCTQCGDTSEKPKKLNRKSTSDHGAQGGIMAYVPGTTPQVGGLPGGTSGSVEINSSSAPPQVAKSAAPTIPKATAIFPGSIQTLRDHANTWAEVHRFELVDTDSRENEVLAIRWSDPTYWNPAAKAIRDYHRYMIGTIEYRVVAYGASNKTGSLLVGVVPHGGSPTSKPTYAATRAFMNWQSLTFNEQRYTDYYLDFQADSMRTPSTTENDTGAWLMAFLEEPVANTLGTGTTTISLALQMRLSPDFVFTTPLYPLPTIATKTIGEEAEVALKDILGFEMPSSKIRFFADSRASWIDKRAVNYFPQPRHVVLPDVRGATYDIGEREQIATFHLGEIVSVPIVVDGSLTDDRGFLVCAWGTGDSTMEVTFDANNRQTSVNFEVHKRHASFYGKHKLTSFWGPYGIIHILEVDMRDYDAGSRPSAMTTWWENLMDTITYSVNSTPTIEGSPGFRHLPAVRVACTGIDYPTIVTNQNVYQPFGYTSTAHTTLKAWLRGKLGNGSHNFSLRTEATAYPMTWRGDFDEITVNLDIDYGFIDFDLDEVTLSSFSPVNSRSAGPAVSSRNWISLKTAQAQAAAALGLGELAALMGFSGALGIANIGANTGGNLILQNDAQKHQRQMQSKGFDFLDETISNARKFEAMKMANQNSILAQRVSPYSKPSNLEGATSSTAEKEEPTAEPTFYENMTAPDPDAQFPPAQHVANDQPIGMDNLGHGMLAAARGTKHEPKMTTREVENTNRLVAAIQRENDHWRDAEMVGKEGRSNKEIKFVPHYSTPTPALGDLAFSRGEGKYRSLVGRSERNVNYFDTMSLHEHPDGSPYRLPYGSDVPTTGFDTVFGYKELPPGTKAWKSPLEIEKEQATTTVEAVVEPARTQDPAEFIVPPAQREQSAAESNAAVPPPQEVGNAAETVVAGTTDSESKV